MKRIRKLLIANRGEIARRIARSCRELGIAVVAVYSDVDEHEPFVHEADEAVRLAGAAATDTYLRGDKVIEAALLTGADAVHPGYGFLAENAAFAAACAETGLTFVGPSPHSIAAMGSKIESKKIMKAAGVPTLPAVEVTVGAPDDDIASAAAGIGYPVLVKASAGGGGKGMRIVTGPEDLIDSVAAARREAGASFDDDAVFLERYLPEVRHVEIQVLGDGAGTIAHLFERECSIQRRHQKIIEESPSPALDEALRKEIGEAAVAAADAVDYIGAGTVEFLLLGDEFFFLEMNTRLQVEHAVTELVTGLDLVALQIRIAEGEPLPAEVVGASLHGHAIEARLYAEDPGKGFLPVAGTVHRLRVPEAVRTDAGPGDGSVVTPHYDPMIAKIVAHGPTRDAAAAKLAKALTEAEIYGIKTNRELLVRILDSTAFLAGETNTAFLDGADLAAMSAPLNEDHRLNALAATIAGQEGRRRRAAALSSIPSGWRNAPSQPNIQGWETPAGSTRIGYRFERNGLVAEIDGKPLQIEVHAASPTAVDLTADGVRRKYRVHRDGRRVWVAGNAGQSDLVQVSRFLEPATTDAPGSLLSPMPGKVIEVASSEGSSVTHGDVVVIIEAMKMEHAVRSPIDGVVTSVPVRVGDQVDADQVLAVVAVGTDSE